MLANSVSVRVIVACFPVGVSVGMRVVVVMMMVMAMAVTVFMVVVMGTDAHRVFTGQSTSAFLAHQSTSNEVSSISRPARSSMLGQWQSGHSANIRVAANSWLHVAHQNRAGTSSMSN
jgi:hypothetical protein